MNETLNLENLSDLRSDSLVPLDSILSDWEEAGKPEFKWVGAYMGSDFNFSDAWDVAEYETALVEIDGDEFRFKLVYGVRDDGEEFSWIGEA